VERQSSAPPRSHSGLSDYWQLSPQIDPASLTQMPSHVTSQQYGSCAQISLAHVSQLALSFAPVSHTLCLQVPLPPPPDELLPLLLLELPPEPLPPPQVSPQIESTSPTQIGSHFVLQQ
jgi:hypothetical protein